MRKIWKEFKEFAVKGSAVDLAVGVIIGAAFGGIINSLERPKTGRSHSILPRTQRRPERSHGTMATSLRF